MSSPKLPAFAGRCHVQLLPGTAAHVADTARMLQLLQPAPEPLRAGSDRANGLLWLLLAVLLLAGLSNCKPSQAARRHRDEHPAPGRYTWYWADQLPD